MNNFPPHTIDSAPEEAKEALRATEKRLGFVPNMLSVLAESPVALEAYQGIQAVFGKSSFSPAEQMFTALVVSITNGCTYCVPVYSMFALKSKVPDDVVNGARDGGAIEDARYRALRDFTVCVVDKRGHVTDDDISAFLNAGFTKAQVLEVIVASAFKLISNYTNHIADIPLDEAFQPYAWDGEKAA
ncbi:MAG: carboxymuconolactone decarboxylase family protein [Proteobacteria bacterium]|nr:carboxymuconolactone decarboxylase family protein [Pseudomonadota bacterium]